MLGSLEVGDITARINLSGPRIQTVIAAPQWNTTLRATTSTEAPRTTTALAEIQGLDLARLAIRAEGERPLQGVVQGRIEAQGVWGQWEDFNVQGLFDEVSIATSDDTVGVRGEGELGFQDRVLRVGRLALTSGSSRLEIHGELALDETAREGVLSINGEVDVSPIPGILGLDVEEAFMDGVVRIQGAVQGTLQEPEPRLDLALAQGAVSLPETIRPITGLGFQASVDPESIRIERAEAEWSGARLSLEGSAPTKLLWSDASDGAASSEFKATVSDLDLGAFEAVPEAVTGRLSFDIEARADAPAIEALNAVAHISGLEVVYGDVALRQARPGEIVMENGVAEIREFELSGPRTEVSGSGTVAMVGDPTADLHLKAKGDAASLALISDAASAAGSFELDAAVTGSLDDLRLDGDFRLLNGRVALDEPRLDAVGLDVAVRFTRDRVELERLTGELNGGPMRASGGFGYGSGQIQDVGLSFSADGLFMDFPEGFRSLSRANLTLKSDAEGLLQLRGRVDIEDGSMRERLDLQSRALDLLAADGLDFSQEPDPFLSRLRYDVAIQTENPVLIDNNLARLEAGIDLRLAGSYYRPALLGRVTLEEGGEVYLAENDYLIETGAVDFVSETRIQPSLNLTARTQVAGHEITMRATGDAEDLETEFSSDTGLPEPDIISLLLTGRTLEDARESGFNIAREQALSYLTGRLGGQISRAAEESLGLSRVRIEPNLISAEDDPSARLTVGQSLTRALELIYSMNLTDAGDQIFVTEYDVTRMFVARAVKQADNSYRFGFRHNLRLGLGLGGESRRSEGTESKEKVGDIRLTGDLQIAESEVRKVFGVESGDRYDFFKTRKQVDRVSAHYRDLDRLEARVRLRREKRDDIVDLELEIDGGPPVRLVYEGADPPAGVRRRVEEAWINGVFEQQRLDDAAGALTAWMDREQHYQSVVRSDVQETGPDERRVLFDITRGPRFPALEPVFQGAEAISAERLHLILDRADLRDKLRADPREVADTLQRFYRQEGFLAAEVSPAELQLSAESGQADAVISIREGPRYRVGELSFEGVSAVSEEALRAAVTPPAQRPYTPEYLEDSIENVERLYWEKGYNDVLVNFRLTQVPEDARVDVSFELVENKQDFVREVTVDGNRHVGEKLIKKRMANEEGEPLISENNDRSRRRLYDTGAFALVDFEAEDLPEAETDADLNPVRLTAKIREVSPFKTRYGAFLDTERGPGVIADFENRNILGSARVTGVRGRFDHDFREARAYFGQPLLRGLPINSSATVFRSREFRRSTFDSGDQQVFITDRTGFTLQQEVSFNRKWILNYGYRFERAHVFDENPDPFFPFDITINVAPLLTTLSFDSRNELLDATRGQFFSHGLEYAPSGLGSSVPMVKYFGQYFSYRSFFRPTPTPFDRKAIRPRLTWASGVRVGLSDGLSGTEVTPFSERFFAGGGTTIRGFRQDGVGPLDFDGAPLGGEAVFLLNQEARFPVAGPFEGVGFVDVGNVYEKIEDFDLSSLRSSAGLGLRVRTPFFLLRLDYGFKLDRKPDESRGEFFFSIGQAF